ncbi:MAG: hypothetical protein JRF64_02540 [Deltaproteobacteria bacterium]|nr:hypothetical protein [Deltaproteobacteria bacterium]
MNTLAIKEGAAFVDALSGSYTGNVTGILDMTMTGESRSCFRKPNRLAIRIVDSYKTAKRLWLGFI